MGARWYRTPSSDRGFHRRGPTAARTTTRTPIGSNPSFAYSSLRPVVVERVQEHRLRAGPCAPSSRGALHDRAREPAVAELLQRVHVLDLRHRPAHVELAHRRRSRRRPARRRSARPRGVRALLGSRRASARSRRDVAHGSRCSTISSAGRSVARSISSHRRDASRARSGVRRCTITTSRSPPYPARRTRSAATDLPYASSSIRISRCGRPASPSTRSASAASAPLDRRVLAVSSTQRKLLSQRSRYPSFRYAMPHANGTMRVLTLATSVALERDAYERACRDPAT